MVLFLVLQIGSIAYAAWISVWDWNLRTGPESFLGLDNYARALRDPVFLRSLENVAFYALVWVPLTMTLGLSLALIVNQRLRGRTFFRAAFYFPAIASSAAITLLWIMLMAPDGLFNQFRATIGINPLFQLLGYGPNQNWMGDQGTALLSVVFLNAWTTSGTVMLFYLAYLQAIPNELYEAAAIDGSDWWHAFWRVTFPLLRPGHYFVTTVLLIGALQLFDQALIGGGVSGDPNNALMTPVLYVYNTAFKLFDFSYSAAVGVILFVVVLAATLVQRQLFGKSPSW